MNVENQFFQFYRSDLIKTAKAIFAGRVEIFVGINAIGKSSLAEQILSTRFRRNFLGKRKVHMVLLSFKDKNQPTSEQLYQYWLSQTAKVLRCKLSRHEPINDFSFYSQMSEMLNRRKESEKIAFIILDAQQILNQSEAFFNSLVYLHIYSYGKVSYLFLSEPHILSCPNPGLQNFLQRFTRYKYNFLKTFDRKTTIADIKRQEKLLKTKFKQYQSLIVKYSRGLHGAIRIFCYLLRDNPWVRNIRQFKKIIYNDKLSRFWVREVLESLPIESLRILKEVSLNREKFNKYKKDLYGQWLVNLSFLKRNGILRYSLMLPILKEFSPNGKEKKSAIKLVKKNFFINGEKTKLSKNEFLILHILYKMKGKLVTYDQIGNILWKNQPDKFSLWAIAQIIRRLKKRLAFYLIRPQIIRSIRGEGYLLN